MGEKVKFQIVRFNPNGDGVTALYINGKLDRYGDYYHDKIDEVLDGFKQGLEFARVDFEWVFYSCNDEKTNIEICEYADSPEPSFDELKGIELNEYRN